ncbi:hypothetical protein EUX98_g8903 [Antrodiella citrinella]|uniref:Peptidase S28 n=1 Tax=Antrodiella citrinella TaxID=2447956 RepID=A0A4S4M3F6_9APHY|nr:hypothetical protein EUX98_g8903 [Antrodiella citrinella]
MVWKSLILSLALATSALSRVAPPRPSVPIVSAPDTPFTDVNGTVLPPLNTTYFFDQLIDHTNPSLGTFKQRFWTTWEFYEPGGAIIIMTPGEANAAPYTGYLTNKTINGQIAQQEHGATIIIEHRFFGLSNPYPDLSVKSLQFLTIQQAIDDLEYFTKNVNLPMPGGDNVKPGQAPWILVGGSYSGALTSWTMVNKPGLFAAAYASSAVVEAITDYWGYFEPIRQFMPKNCSADVEAVVAHVDQVFTSGNTAAINSLKASFGMTNLTHLDDVASALKNNLYDWQDLAPDSGPNAQFFQFCDALEVKNGVNAPASGWGLDHALEAWSTYFSQTYLDILCGDDGIVDCLGSYDATSDFYTDTSVDNANRSWFWFVCNQVGWLQESAPQGWPSLVTRTLTPAYDERQCSLMFPAQFPKPPQVNVAPTNTEYKGWNVQIDHLFFANGQRDPWREATVSADGQHFQSTAGQPIAVGNGYHCSDLATANAAVDSTIKAVQVKALAAIKPWIASYKTSVKRSPKWGRDVAVAA